MARAPRPTDRRRKKAGTVSLDEEVFNAIRTMIAERRLLPGEHVVPERLAKEMSVSRTPVVNALKRLKQDGLIDWVTNSGAFVKRFTRLEIAQIFELREVMEGLSARHAARNLSVAEIDALEELFADFQGLPEGQLSPRVVRAYLTQDRKFHRAIIDAGASPPLRRAIDLVHVTTAADSAGLIRTVSVGVAEHQVILQAFRDRDPEAAEAAMRTHLNRSVVWLYEEAEAEKEQALADDEAAAEAAPQPRSGRKSGSRTPAVGTTTENSAPASGSRARASSLIR